MNNKANRASKKISKEAHRLRMLERKSNYERDRLAYLEDTVFEPVLANISVNHKDYGLSPAEHEANKRVRNL